MIAFEKLYSLIDMESNDLSMKRMDKSLSKFSISIQTIRIFNPSVQIRNKFRVELEVIDKYYYLPLTDDLQILQS
jgi:hypothetical protein